MNIREKKAAHGGCDEALCEAMVLNLESRRQAWPKQYWNPFSILAIQVILGFPWVTDGNNKEPWNSGVSGDSLSPSYFPLTPSLPLEKVCMFSLSFAHPEWPVSSSMHILLSEPPRSQREMNLKGDWPDLMVEPA